MILTSHTIEGLSCEDGKDLIVPFKSEHLRGSSYDLTIGDEYYIGENNKRRPLTTERLRPSQSFTVPPHAICFILTEESINLPRDITAKISLRMTHIYEGMMLTSQPPFDPGYRGKVIIMLHNLSSSSVHFKQGERVATIEFSRLDEPSKDMKPHRSVQTLQSQLGKPLTSSLSEIASVSNRARDKVDSLVNQTLIFVTIILAAMTAPGIITYSLMSSRLDDQKVQIKDLSESLASHIAEINRYREDSEMLRKKLTALMPSHQISPEEAFLLESPGNGVSE